MALLPSTRLHNLHPTLIIQTPEPYDSDTLSCTDITLSSTISRDVPIAVDEDCVLGSEFDRCTACRTNVCHCDSNILQRYTCQLHFIHPLPNSYPLLETIVSPMQKKIASIPSLQEDAVELHEEWAKHQFEAYLWKNRLDSLVQLNLDWVELNFPC